ncbi:MAG: HIT domain-containing protein [Proteobacteria bacterium]|nr:HIT domain-containing protein [Pseudomonadota bacterium]
MDRLWAPWRIKYILSNKAGNCIFCVKPSRKGDRKRLILFRSDYSLIMLNRFPYNSGHLLVAPVKHTGDLEELTAEELNDLSVLLRKTVSLLRRAMAPQGYNIGMNIGQVGGAGFTDHLHFHVVPRWVGDTNFMPVSGETIVIPESLEETYEKLNSMLRDVKREGE